MARKETKTEFDQRHSKDNLVLLYSRIRTEESSKWFMPQFGQEVGL